MTALKPGDRVIVNWNGTYPALKGVVVRVTPKGNNIHFTPDGYPKGQYLYVPVEKVKKDMS